MDKKKFSLSCDVNVEFYFTDFEAEDLANAKSAIENKIKKELEIINGNNISMDTYLRFNNNIETFNFIKVYKVNKISLSHMRKIDFKEKKDISLCSAALIFLSKYKEVNFCNEHEFWLHPMSLDRDIGVIIRLNSNPYDAGYLVSPVSVNDERLKELEKL